MPSSEPAACGDALASKLRLLLRSGALGGADTCCGRSLRPGLTPRINPSGSGPVRSGRCPARRPRPRAATRRSRQVGRGPATTHPRARRCAAPVRAPRQRPPATTSSRWRARLPGAREGAEAGTEWEEAVAEEAEAPAKSRRENRAAVAAAAGGRRRGQGGGRSRRARRGDRKSVV